MRVRVSRIVIERLSARLCKNHGYGSGGSVSVCAAREWLKLH